MEKPKVGIITRTKNRTILLRRAIESVLGQIHQDWKMIIVNDGGTPADVENLVAQYAEKAQGRIKICHNPKSLGMEAASNVGLRAIDSDYVVIHDDDDSWHPSFLQHCVSFLDNNSLPSVKGVITHSIRIIESIDGADIVLKHQEPFNQWLREITLYRMAAGNIFPPISFVYHKDVLDEIGYYREDFPVLGDWEFNLRFLRRFDIFLIPEGLAYYHHRVTSETGEYSNSVIKDDSHHKFYDALLRNEMLRKDLDAGGLGLGYLMNVGRSFETAHAQIAPIEAFINSLRNIRLLKRIRRFL